jgi:hypothetical protein
MNISKIILAGILMVSLCSGALVQNEVRLLKGQGISISGNQIKTVMEDCPLKCDLPSHCDTLKRTGVDLAFFATGLWDDFECGCGGDIIELLSIDTIRQIKAWPIDFDKPLEISDTAHFSFASQWTCSLWAAHCPDTQNFCYPCHPLRSFPIIWQLGKTANGNYFLFRSVARHSDATIEYILQTDGSLNFKGATVAVKDSEKRAGRSHKVPGPALVKRFGIPAADTYGDKIYDIRGRLINAAFDRMRRVSHAPMVFIVKRAHGID